MAKRFAIKHEGSTYRNTSATLYIDDPHGDYSQPRIVLTFHKEGDDSDYYDVTVDLAFQRNALNRTATSMIDTPATDYMDTARPWGHCYAGTVRLRNAETHPISDTPFTLDTKDQIRVKVARKIAAIINEYNLHRGEPDECKRAVEALDKYLHTPVEKVHVYNGVNTPYYNVDHSIFGTNRKAQ